MKDKKKKTILLQHRQKYHDNSKIKQFQMRQIS